MKKKFITFLFLVFIGFIVFATPATTLAAEEVETCGWTNMTGCFLVAVAWVAEKWLALASWLLWAAGLIFDFSVSWSVVGFKEWIDKSIMVSVGWSVFRDMANVTFIFIILYIAIGMILQISSVGNKKLLANVIIIALLINFSSLITKVVIDVSNVVAYQFYKEVNSSNDPTSNNNISKKLVAGTTLTSFFQEPDNYDGGFGGAATGFMQIVVNTGHTTLLILIMSLVLIAGAVMFFLRTFYLIFLIIVSPLAFMAYAFPGLGGHFKNWWNKLFSQAFFAPIFLVFIFITIKAITNRSIRLGIPGGGSANVRLITLTMDFVVLVGMLLGSMIMASRLGAIGAKQMTKLGHNLRGRAQSFAGRGTLGKASRRIAESDLMKWTEKKSPRIGGTLRNIAEYGAKQKFGGKTSYEDEIKQRVKASERFKDKPEAQAEYLKNLGPGLLSRTLQRVPVAGRAISATSQPQEAIYDKLKPEQKVELERVLGEQSSKAWGSVKTVEDLDKERNAIHTKYQTIRNWHQTTPDAQKLTADNWEKRQEYNRYQKELEQVNKQYKGAETEQEPQKVLTARLQAAQPFQKRFNIIRDLRDNLSEADKGKFKSVIQKKGRDKKIKDLEAIPKDLRTETQRDDLIKLIQERKEDKDREALAGAAREAAKEGAKEGGGEGGGGGDKKKDEK